LVIHTMDSCTDDHTIMLASTFDELTLSCFYFFFQAEDAIRDRNVTGVQTCALPISMKQLLQLLENDCTLTPAQLASMTGSTQERSEERRVGKEWRRRRWRKQLK